MSLRAHISKIAYEWAVSDYVFLAWNWTRNILDEKYFFRPWRVFDPVVDQVVMWYHRPGMTSERKIFYGRLVQSNESCTNTKTDLRNIAPSRSYGRSKFGTSGTSTVGTKDQISKRLFFPWSLVPTTQVRHQIRFLAKISPFGNTVWSGAEVTWEDFSLKDVSSWCWLGNN